MNKDYDLAIESFIEYLDEMEIAEEQTIENSIIFPFDGRKFNCKLMISGVDGGHNAKEKQIIEKVKRFIKTKPLDNPALWKSLYEANIKWFDEINRDPYFDGRKILSADDLKNSISDINLLCMDPKENIFFVCGEYWVDPEHGFSINFPNGKFRPFHGEDHVGDMLYHWNKLGKTTLLGIHSDAY